MGKGRTPIFPVSERLLGISFVCSIVPMMSSSNSDILTDWESACERESFVLSSFRIVLVEAGMGEIKKGIKGEDVHVGRSFTQRDYVVVYT